MLDAGVIDKDVDAAELFGRHPHHVFDLGRLAHVGAVVGDLDAVLGDRRLGPFDVAETIEHDIGALLRQRLRNTQTDAAGGPGDQCSFSFEQDVPPIHLGCA